ncbi:MAG TPA: type 1 glutamine amidotransferase domain-containing protein [Dokdonella sp.]|uniref:type 1 glutamine amidotransferase domain-containing protein n=1 Tax=Dokdonella sp. TaxID=2291710 RepID=UPI002BA52AC2|nr:type 1 glutamine amidotransferase domain-containing protein [Dokdonella sp.]HUD40829.1 type 1 glutamine amidotransferase domain-containing protein [Dokdonella sp.]
MKTLLTAALAFACILPSSAAQAGDTVLIVLSGEGRDAGKARPGYEMDELAQAWSVFADNGLTVEVASPRGGAVEADRYDPADPFNARLLADAAKTAQLADTRPIDALQAEDYAGVFVVGGKGAMFDLPRDPALARLIGRIAAQGGIVAAVCHGPAALTAVRDAAGRALAAGRAMTGFTNEEEALFGKRWSRQYPFLLEDALRGQEARWSEARPMLPHVVVDGRLITGQNPYSTLGAAEALVRATGRVPVARTPSRDERSLERVQQVLRGEAIAAADALAADIDGHHAALIGMLGYYHLQAASDDAAVADAVAVMRLAEPHFAEPRLQVAIADGEARLGHTASARERLGRVLAAHPQMNEARQLLARIDG